MIMQETKLNMSVLPTFSVPLNYHIDSGCKHIILKN